jgi:antitoxin (DNA-binding transcriptional repressor) of toxin-antitoxin stability system
MPKSEYMQTLNAAEFGERCLQLLEDLPLEGIMITKMGRPIAKLMPVLPSCFDLIGSVKGLAADPEDDLFSTGLTWATER